MKKKINKNSLMQVENDIFNKIRRILFKFIKREKKSDIVKDTSEIALNRKRFSFLEKINNSQIEQEIVLQSKYENGDINVAEMTEEEFKAIENRYINQIQELKKKIEKKNIIIS